MSSSLRTRLLAVVAFLAVIAAILALKSRAASPPVTTSAAALNARGELAAPKPRFAGGAFGESPDADAEWFVDRTSAPLTLSGRVLSNGAPAAGASVVLTDGLPRGTGEPGRPDRPRARVATNERGEFVFDGVPRLRGWYRVEAYGAERSPASVWIPGDASKHDIELLLEPCSLHVYGAVRDASGGPVVGARVSLDGLPQSFVLSAADGKFRLCTGPRAGRIRVEAAGYGTWFARVSPRGELRQDVSLSPKAALAGTVVTAASGSPVPFARVTVRAEGNVIAEAIADRGGGFLIDDVAPGAYAVEARGPRASTKAPVDVNVFAGETNRMRVPLEMRTGIRGRVLSPAGPVANAAISVGVNATFEWSLPARTDDGGAFVLDDAPVGARMYVKVEEYEVDTPKSVDVPESGLDDLVVRVASRLELVVTVSRKGEPVRQANVSLRGPVSSASRVTAADGKASFRNLLAGRYRLVAEQGEDFGVVENVQVASSGVTTASVELGAGHTVEGRVVDVGGKPVDGARVDFTLASSSQDGSAFVVTGADGSFRGGPLRTASTYSIEVSRSRFRLEPKGSFPRVKVGADGRVDPARLELVVAPQDRELRGAVVDPAGGPIRDVRVTISRPDAYADALTSTSTGNDGTFSMTGLGSGPYTVKAIDVSGSEVEVKNVSLPTSPLVLTLAPAGTVTGTVSGFARTPTVMAWKVTGYRWDFRPAVIESSRFSISGLAAGRYHVAATTSDATASATVDVSGGAPTHVDLVASAKRTIRGRVLDFASHRGLPGMSCQAAPFVGGARSPVVVPGVAFTDGSGGFALVDAPAGDLYIWCWGEGRFRGGAARIPPEASGRDSEVVVWGLDVEGRTPVDATALGMTFDADYPLSRRLLAITPRGAAARAGIVVGDVVLQIGTRSLDGTGNGLALTYLAFVLAETKSTPIVVLRDGAPVALELSLETGP